MIIGYHIHARVGFSHQPLAVKVGAAITTLMLFVGLLGGTLSALTFSAEGPRKFGCGVYLLTSAINSLALVVVFALKFVLLVLSQMALITNRTTLFANCISLDFLQKVLLSTADWVNACVAIERTISASKGVKFNKVASRRCARLVITAIYPLVIASYIHDPLHRYLIDDKEEQRTWCVINYSPQFTRLNSAFNTLHFVVPFVINLLSALIIIVTVARKRSAVQRKQNYKEHLKMQLRYHKHLIISPCALVILALPRLIISFVSDCMKSAREPWLFLFAYYISFVPSIVSFAVFVLPSQMYIKEFLEIMTRMRIAVRLHRA